MAMARAAALPGSLEGAAAAVDLPYQKDRDGALLMRRMARPRRPRKDEDRGAIRWVDGLEERVRLFTYCLHDVARGSIPRVVRGSILHVARQQRPRAMAK
jgi:hypothetical protein